MNIPDPPAPPPAPAPPAPPSGAATAATNTPRPPLVLRVLSIAARVVMVLGILGCGYALLDLYRNLFTEPQEPIPPLTTQPGPAPADPAQSFRELLLDDGVWTVGGVGWAARVRTLPADELARRTASPGEPVPAGRAESEIERNLLKWAKGAERAPLDGHPGCTAYRSAFGEFLIRVVTENVGGAERMRLGQIVWGGGTLLEFTPAPGGEGTAEPLLPVPSGMTVQARRWTAGRVTAELIGPWAVETAYPGAWADAGWVGRSLAPPDPEGGAADGDAGYEFRRGSEVVWVWRFGLPGGGGGLLLARPQVR